jgi:hypothetical protein
MRERTAIGAHGQVSVQSTVFLAQQEKRTECRMFKHLRSTYLFKNLDHYRKVTFGVILEFFWPVATLALITLVDFNWTGKAFSINTVSIFILPLLTPIFMFYGACFRISHKEKQTSNAQQIIDSITGGNSYPLVHISIIDNGMGVDRPFKLWLTVSGDYSVYDLALTVTDLRQLAIQNEGYDPPVSIRPPMQKHQLGTLGKGYEVPLQQIHLVDSDRVAFTIMSVARNGSFTQVLVARKVGDQWPIATRIKMHKFGVDSKLDKVVHEYIQPTFPKEWLTDLDV